MIRIDPSVAVYADAYVAGWAHSRGAPSPQAVRHGWYVPTNTPQEPERYVLTSGGADDVRRIRDSLTLAGSCLKFAGDRADWLWLIDAAWEENPVGWFMSRDIDATCVRQPSMPALAVTTETTIADNVARVEVRHQDRIVASGRAGLVDGWAVPDRIRTSDEHRRRGLGRFVMDHLMRLACLAGARRAVLDSSTEGRPLYTAMGWSIVAGQFGINRPAP